MAEQQQVQTVLSTIRAALSINNVERQAAEAQLQAWEQDAAPGFALSLIRIIEETGAVDEPTRLLAAVIAKNTVGSSWRKTLGTREWSRVPPEEKAAVRDSVLRLLLSDPSERVSVQLALLLRNICQFDFPGSWPTPVDSLLSAAGCVDPATGGPLAPERGLRALKALKQVLRGLQTKRFVADAAAPGTPFAVVTERLNAERKLFKERLAAAVTPLQALLARHMQAFMTCADGWQLHGAFARAAAASCTELTLLLPSREALPGGDDAATKLLEAVHTACSALMRSQPLAGDPGGPSALSAWNELGGKLHERLAAMVTALMAACPLPFGPLMPYFLDLFVGSALVAADADTLRAMRPKRRVLLVRFIAKALLCPYYRAEWLEVNVNMLAAGTAGLNSNTATEVERARKAHDALSAMLAPPQVGPLVEALVAKYVALSRDELDEWQNDPEGYIRSLELEAAPDADTPRPVGVGLLLCMLERGGEGPARALIDLAAQLQNQGDGASADVLLMREACYRAIGEGFPHVSSFISFAKWYSAEIAPQLRDRLPAFQTPGGANIIMAVLQARALWLVGACCGELPQQQWVEAFGLCVAHMAAADLVVALQAVQAVMMMVASMLDDQAVLDQANAAQLQASKAAARGGAGAIDAALTAAEVLDQDAVVAARERSAWRGEVLRALLSELLSSCFGLLRRLSEAESRVRLLQLVSVVAEASGEALRPHLGALAAALPQVWEAATSIARRPDADTGSVARLHSALMAVLTHLVGKLRASALEDAGIQGVLYPLLQYATDPASPEADVLLEEALKLWAVVQGASPTVTQPLVDLLPRMAALLRRGRDNTAAFQLVEGYLLLGGGGALQPYGEAIAAALAAALNGVSRTVAEACTPQGPPAGQQQPQAQQPPAPQQRQPGGGARGPLASEVTQEGLAAAALVDVFLQLYPADVTTLLAGSFTAMGRLIADPRVPTAGIQMKAHNVMEGFLEVLGRLFISAPNTYPALMQAIAAAEASEQQQQQEQQQVGISEAQVGAVQHRYLDRWLSVANVTLLEEAIGVRHMAMLGRFRRRMAAAGLATLINGGALPPSALDPKSVANLVGLMVKVLREIPEFRGDVAHLDGMDFAGELGSDYVLAARVNLSKNDVIRSLPLFETFRSALTALAASVGGPVGLTTLLGMHSRVAGVSEAAQQLLDGTLEEVLAARRAQHEAARQALLAGWSGDGDGDDDLD